ncbi:Ig-like domain-containing protein [Carboxydothermus pertinax]|uniref:Big-1 domain-containing protein n=1 Tax=Carboxydothermus pertinax TaxID=870242 RepID=A0A1L8CTH2_9THEO|nr:SH3 domain-containing protein [Carboxydothermus pertinax]GAV22226.1 hypothetical protein cpu_07360 [Carboxydothermus pertinax]
MAKFKHKKPIAILTIVAFLLSMLPAVVFADTLANGIALYNLDNQPITSVKKGDGAIIKGRLVDNNGAPISNSSASVKLVTYNENDGTVSSVAYETYAVNGPDTVGNFTISVPKFVYSAKYYVYEYDSTGTTPQQALGYVVVNPVTFTPTLSTNTVLKGAYQSFDISIPANTVTENTYAVQVVISGVAAYVYNADGNSVGEATYQSYDPIKKELTLNVAQTQLNDGKININFNDVAKIKFTETGTATITVKIAVGDQSTDFTYPEYVGSANLTVAGNDDLNIALSKNQTNVNDSVNDNVYIFITDKNGATAFDAVYLSESGAGVDQPYTEITNNITNGYYIYALNKITQGGTLTLTVKAKKGTNEYVKSATLNVDGYVVTPSVTSATYDTEFPIKFIVKDLNGNFVNNAQVFVDSSSTSAFVYKASDGKYYPATNVIVSAQNTNINNGEYNATLKGVFVGKYRFEIRKLDGTTVMAKVPFQVLGLNTLSISADKTAVVVGNADNITLTVLDNGNALANTPVNVVYNFSDTTASVTYSSIGTSTDSLGKITISNLNITKVGTLTLTVSTTDNKKVGTFTINAVAPKVYVDVPADNVLTDGFKETVTVRVYDPRNNTELNNASIQLVPVKDSNNVDTVNLITYSDKNYSNQITGSVTGATYTFYVKASDNTTVAAAPQVQVKVNGLVAATLDVKPHTITVDKTSIELNKASFITVTVKDAHGKPVANQTITFDGQSYTLGDDGTVVVYYTAQNSTADRIVKLAGFDNVVAKVKVLPPGTANDTTTPTIEVLNSSLTVNTPYILLNIKATDDNKVTNLVVGEKQIPILANKEVNTVVKIDLVEGENPVVIQASDAAGNVATKTITVKYEKPVTPPSNNNGGNTGDKYSKFVGQMVQLTYTKTNLRVAPQANAKILAVLKKGYKMRYLGREGVWNKVRVSIWSNGGYKTYTGYIYDPYYWTLTSIQ